MTINEFIWPQDRIEHIGKHGIEPNEFEEICFGEPLVQRAKASGENPVYYVLGQTAAGLHLFASSSSFPMERAFPSRHAR